MLVELKNGDTYNGRLVSCDTWMNITLRDVICTSRVRRKKGEDRKFVKHKREGVALGLTITHTFTTFPIFPPHQSK